MADLVRLRQMIRDSGMTIKSIAERAEINRYTLDRRLRGKGEFTASEIVGLSRALNMRVSERNDIFLQ